MARLKAMAGKRRAPRAPSFGEWLLRARGANSRDHICRRLWGEVRVKCDGTQLSNYEDGRVPPVDILWGLSRVFSVPVDELMRSIAAELGLKAELGPPIAGLELSQESEDLMPLLRGINPDKVPDFLRDLAEMLERYHSHGGRSQKRDAEADPANHKPVA